MESTAELKRICRRENYRDNLKTMFFAARVSIYFTRLLLMLNLTANQVTVMFIFAGIASAISFLGQGLWWFAAGYLLQRMHVILDVCDGEVARYRQTFSPVGGYLDFLTHYFVYALILFFISLRLYLDTGWFPALIAGFVLVISNTMIRAATDCWFRANFNSSGRDEIEEGRNQEKRSSLPGWLKKVILLAAHTTSIQTFLNAYLIAVIMAEYSELDIRMYILTGYAVILFLFSIVRIAFTIKRGKIPRRATYYK